MSAQLTQTWYNARVMSHLFADKRLLLCRLCGILARWLVFGCILIFVGIAIAALFEFINVDRPILSFVLLLFAAFAGVYAALRAGKYIISKLKTKSTTTVILILIALIIFVYFFGPSIFIYTEFQ